MQSTIREKVVLEKIEDIYIVGVNGQPIEIVLSRD